MTLDKHDCFIQTADGKVLHKPFTIANNCESFEELYSKILACNDADIRVELEVTGHYFHNLLGFLLSKELATFVFNLFQTNQFRKSLSLRKTKTDKVDARTIALMLATEYSDNAYSLQTKILAFAGLSPSTYQSGKFTSQNATMEKRGSRYLRRALFLAARLVGRYSKTFAFYLQKKRDEGKHYFIALSHVAKKLVRVIFHLQRTGESFLDFA